MIEEETKTVKPFIKQSMSTIKKEERAILLQLED